MNLPKILDCTLRDGGYYTNWDFDRKLVEEYITALSELPVDYVEVGYRTKELDEYAGEYRYLPVSTMKWLKGLAGSRLKIAVMLDEKDVGIEDVSELLQPVIEYCDMIRLAIAPNRLANAIDLAKEIKKFNVEVGFNIMYMSKVKLDDATLSLINSNKEFIDYFYLVDSFGGVVPQDVTDKFSQAVSTIETAIGFHGHNNMELALANSMAAISCGATIIDATITGMGRGAGNLKTELLLTYFQSRFGLKFNYSLLTGIVKSFENLQAVYRWGTNFPYMISGANSLPQKDVMNWMGKKRYTVNAIVQALSNQSSNETDNVRLPVFDVGVFSFTRVAIIGGGKSVHNNHLQIRNFLSAHPDILVIHSSARNVGELLHIPNKQIMCMTGNEGAKLNDPALYDDINLVNSFVYPPYPRQMGTYIPQTIADKSYQLAEISFINEYYDAPLTLSLQIILNSAQSSDIILLGFDGYTETLQTNAELKDETQMIIDSYQAYTKSRLTSYTPTNYHNLAQRSFYALL